MLGKTAGGIFWMFRYLERAENIARLIETGWRIALTRSSAAEAEWESVLNTAGLRDSFMEKHDGIEAHAVINYLLRGKTQGSSVMSAFDAARQNARLVRTALTSEVWEATNETWMDMKAMLARPVAERDLAQTLSAVRYRSAVVRGALHGTMLRNDIFSFARLGTFIERADNTARILDVKYYVLLPSAAYVGSQIDNAQWETILRSVSAVRSFRMISGGNTTPKGIAHFLILDPTMPRSLMFCAGKIRANLRHLESAYGCNVESRAIADAICSRLEGRQIDDIFDEGLHEVLQRAVNSAADLAHQIEKDFRFYG